MEKRRGGNGGQKDFQKIEGRPGRPNSVGSSLTDNKMLA